MNGFSSSRAEIRNERVVNENQTMNHHFSRVASSYRQVRTTDFEPIQFMGEVLKNLSPVKAADIGCGAGRYDHLLFQRLNHLHLTCIDMNEPMLRQVSDYLTHHYISDFETINADGKNIPLQDNSMDCIFTFNAVHHFNFQKFLEESGRIIKPNGRSFIYTRPRSQNAENIWGQYFPLFSQKENRLYELREMEQSIQSVRSLELEITKSFRYKRDSNIEQLVDKVEAKHYSTFSLYEENELAESLQEFQKSLKEFFRDSNQIEWYDENILLVLKRN